jgi:nitroreductase
VTFTREALKGLSAGPWWGKANELSPIHAADWPVIDEAALASLNPGKTFHEDSPVFPKEEDLFDPPVRSGAFTAEKVILGRRSAVSMDGSTRMPLADFYRMMGRLCPAREGLPPWDAIPWRPRIHLGLFIHRVEGLRPGLYALVRDRTRTESLRKAFRTEFEWKSPPGCPPRLSLYCLREGDYRGQAAGLSCGQNIAGDGAFSLGMIAEFRASLAAYGPSFYRNLFWEAGLIGQVLYLEAEESGIRGTGIGCYFDDPVHDLFGLGPDEYQSLYHFTVGGPVEDKRLATRPAYERN